MFERTVTPKERRAVRRLPPPRFELTTNGITQRFPDYMAAHVEVYETPVRYSIRYDEDPWVETADRVAVRMWITTERQRESPTELELVLIATFLDGKLHRLWELTWPGRVTDGRLRGVPRRPQAALSRTTRSRCRNRYRMRTSAAPASHAGPTAGGRSRSTGDNPAVTIQP